MFTNILTISEIAKDSKKCYGFREPCSCWMYWTLLLDNQSVKKYITYWQQEAPITSNRMQHNRQLHKAMLSIQPIPDKRLRIKVALLQQMIEKKSIQKLNWIYNSSQTANSLTKLGASGQLLLRKISKLSFTLLLYLSVFFLSFIDMIN